MLSFSDPSDVIMIWWQKLKEFGQDVICRRGLAHQVPDAALSRLRYLLDTLGHKKRGDHFPTF